MLLEKTAYRRVGIDDRTYRDILNLRSGKETWDDLLRRLIGLPPIPRRPSGRPKGYSPKKKKLEE